jgi:hypothetical protein
MTAPTASAFTTFPQGPGQATDNLTGLLNNQTKGLGIVGSSATDAKDIKIGCVKITTGTIPGSPSGTGTASLYLAISEDGTNFTDGLNPNSTDGVAEGNKFITSQSIGSMLIQKLACPASNTTYIFNSFSVVQKIGYVPTFIGLYVVNNTGATFSATAANFLAGYKLITYN